MRSSSVSIGRPRGIGGRVSGCITSDSLALRGVLNCVLRTASGKACDADAANVNGKAARILQRQLQGFFQRLLMKAHTGSLSSASAHGVAVPKVEFPGFCRHPVNRL